jgi:hypothetical protein
MVGSLVRANRACHSSERVAGFTALNGARALDAGGQEPAAARRRRSLFAFLSVAMPNIRLPDGSIKQFEQPVTVAELPEQGRTRRRAFRARRKTVTSSTSLTRRGRHHHRQGSRAEIISSLHGTPLAHAVKELFRRLR